MILLLALLAAPADDRPLSRIVFASCLHQDKPQPIWTPIAKADPDLFLFLGDCIYSDTEDMDKMRKQYSQLGAQEGYKAVQKRCPVLATWDDHDYGKNDAGREYPRKKEAQQVFLDFFGVPKDSPRRKREGVYHAQVFGPPGKRVQVMLLDTRYHRSPLKTDPKLLPRFIGQYVPDDDPRATFLGDAQWAWLEEQLKVPAELRLIGSSIQLLADEHRYEKWGNFPKEREKLYSLIRKTKADGVVVLSGDRHLAELSMAEPGVGYPIYDITSSGMNQANKRFRKIEPNRHRLAIMDQGDNFGLVRIDWTRDDPVVSLEIRDDEGDTTIRQKIPLSRLRANPAKVSSGADLAAEARKRLGKEWTAEYAVAAVGANRAKTMLYLNSEKDFRSERNFVVVLDLKALEQELEDAGIKDARKHFLGKKIKATGAVGLFNEKPQILVKSLKQVEVLK